jgi:hypothetical protein
MLVSLTEAENDIVHVQDVYLMEIGLEFVRN